MSDEFHRPTLTFQNDGYNATQVRLYGIAGDSGRTVKEITRDNPATFNVAAGGFDITVAISKKDKTAGDGLFASQISITMKKLGTVVMTATISKALAERTGGIITCGVIVGYAYEGHTYDLPKPKIMILPVAPEAKIPEDDSGFKAKEPEGYAVWLVDKLDECAEFEMNQGFIEQLVLEANLPGKRAPNMYVGRMMLGHRSGKLTD